MEMRSRDRSFPCYLRHPDVSFWEAVGHYEGDANRKMNWPRSLTRVGGCWKDHAEFQEAWSSDTYCDTEDAVNQAPRFYTEAPRDRSQTPGGRASSPRQPRR